MSGTVVRKLNAPFIQAPVAVSCFLSCCRDPSIHSLGLKQCRRTEICLLINALRVLILNMYKIQLGTSIFCSHNIYVLSLIVFPSIEEEKKKTKKKKIK